MERSRVPKEDIDNAFKVLRGHLNAVLQKHGDGVFASTHEALGTITEEFHELVEAVRSNERARIINESLDLGALAVFLVACYGRFKVPSDRG